MFRDRPRTRPTNCSGSPLPTTPPPGPGIIALDLAALVGSVIAVDPEKGMLEEGRRLAAEQAITNTDWREGDSTNLPAMGIGPSCSPSWARPITGWRVTRPFATSTSSSSRTGPSSSPPAERPATSSPPPGSRSSPTSAPATSAPSDEPDQAPTPTPGNATRTSSPAPRSPTSKPPAGTAPSPAPCPAARGCPAHAPVTRPGSSDTLRHPGAGTG
jgi:hypothetical protein